MRSFIQEWFASRRRDLSTVSWPGIYSTLFRLLIMVILARALSLILIIIHATLFGSNDGYEAPDYSHPANNLSSVFSHQSPGPSAVIDISNGSMGALHSLIVQHDITVVMMYAPWDHYSIVAADDFTKTAQAFSTSPNVAFIGINCWLVNGNCRSIEGTMAYPRIVIYHLYLDQRFQYFGDKSYNGLTSFITNLLYPLTYITSSNQFNQLLVEHESVVVGYFDFGGNSSVDNHLPFGFMDYYLACLLMIQNSFNTKTFRFAVVTNSNMASLLSLSSPLTIISIRGRQLDVVYQDQMSYSTIHQWTMNNTSIKLVEYLTPTNDLSFIASLSPVAILFTPYNNTPVISTFNKLASSLTNNDGYCSSLRHLLQWECVSPVVKDKLISFPLCRDNPASLCPVFNPLYPDGCLPSSSRTFHCQDGTGMGGVRGGWPPPCHMISLRFYIINSLQYWGLVKSMGVADGGRGHSILIIGDFKVHKIFKMSIDANTTISDYIDHFTRIVIGEVPHVVRSGRASTSCIGSSTSCVHDLTSATFQSLVMEDTDHVILVVHYAPWCLACVHIWPHLYSISSYNNSIIKLMRLNGETNDVSWCHTPSSYPSVALYKIGRKSKPIWYPNDMTINVENLLAFISREGEVSLMMEEREEGDVRGWEGMGWLLWETAERERKSLEEKNIKLALEVNRLRSELNNQNKKEETKSILAQVDSLLNQLMDTSQSDKVTKKEMNNNRQSDDVLEAH